MFSKNKKHVDKANKERYNVHIENKKGENEMSKRTKKQLDNLALVTMRITLAIKLIELLTAILKWLTT